MNRDRYYIGYGLNNEVVDMEHRCKRHDRQFCRTCYVWSTYIRVNDEEIRHRNGLS